MADEFRQECEAIRKAWKAGKKHIMLKVGKRELKFNLKLDSKPVVYTVDGEQKKRTEYWIIATRADGQQLPIYSVERKVQENMRTVAVK